MPDKRLRVRSLAARRWAVAQSVPAFYAVFGLYTAAALFLLLLGLGSALAAASPAILDAFQDAAGGGSRFAPMWRVVVQSAPLSEAPGQVLLDYLLSGVNLGLGVFLVWRRPLDGVARLLGLAMVGTAASFNLQAHTAFAVVDTGAPELHAIVPIHWVLHAVSGAAYLHALLVFPNGKVVPARLVWLVRLAYLFMVEEILLTFVTGSVGLLAVPFQLLFGFQGFNPDALPKLIDSDATFVVVFFGVLLPVAGATSQVYRYLAISEPSERERTRLVVWALTLAFGVGASFLLVAIGSTLARGAGVRGASARGGRLRGISRAAAALRSHSRGAVPGDRARSTVRHRSRDCRTLVYGTLTAVLAVTFFGSVFLLQQVLRSLIGGPNEFAVAVAALVNGLLFQPVRRRIQQVLDRRVRRRTYDAARALAAFQTSLREDEVELEALARRLLATIREVLHPVRMGLWLRDRDQDQVARRVAERLVGNASRPPTAARPADRNSDTEAA